MVALAGGRYVLRESGVPSALVTPEDLVTAAPDVIFVGLCGYDEVKAHADAQGLWDHAWWRGLPAVAAGRVYYLNANAYYARPGPRLVQGTALLAYLLHGSDCRAACCPEGGWKMQGTHPERA